MRKLGRKVWLGALCMTVVTIAAGAATPARGAVDPISVFIPAPPPPPLPIVPPPTGRLNGACGLGIDFTGRLYVSDYYHHVIDVFNGQTYFTQIPKEDPIDGPCGLAFDENNQIFVNNYHHNVIRFSPLPAFGSGLLIETSEPTGVAVDVNLNRVYVNERTYIGVYDLFGNPLLDEGEPLKIGLGTLGDGYGLAISGFPSTLGRLYVPDAASNTVKVYDPAGSKLNPVAEIKDPFGKPFSSLRDSAVAVDWFNGDVYFADNTQPKHTEKPQATIYVYGANGIYKGHLKYNIVDALPPGLAVDNSDDEKSGNVFVTSGNTNQSGIYIYGPGSATMGAPLPPTFSLGVKTSGIGGGSVTSSAAKLDCSDSCQAVLLAGRAITLEADPEAGSEFSGWSGGGCTGTGACVLGMTESTEVDAHFINGSTDNSQSAPEPGASGSSSSGRQTTAQQGTRHRRSAKRCRRARRHHTRRCATKSRQDR